VFIGVLKTTQRNTGFFWLFPGKPLSIKVFPLSFAPLSTLIITASPPKLTDYVGALSDDKMELVNTALRIALATG
jgi:hypothetical protein